MNFAMNLSKQTCYMAYIINVKFILVSCTVYYFSANLLKSIIQLNQINPANCINNEKKLRIEEICDFIVHVPIDSSTHCGACVAQR